MNINRCTNLGKSNNTLYFKNEMVRLTYSDQTGPKFKISFECDENIISHEKISVSQKYFSDFHEFYNFTLQEITKEATAVNVRTKYACLYTPMPCIINSDGEIYDVSELSGIQYSTNFNLKNFRFSICSPLKNVPFNCFATSTLCAKDLRSNVSFDVFSLIVLHSFAVFRKPSQI